MAAGRERAAKSKSGMFCGPSICNRCATFFKTIMEAVKVAVETFPERKYDTWWPFVPPPIRVAKLDSVYRTSLLNTPLGKQKNKFAILGSGFDPSGGDTNDVSSDEECNLLGRKKNCVLEDLPQAHHLVGSWSATCYVCDALVSMVATSRSEVLRYWVRYDLKQSSDHGRKATQKMSLAASFGQNTQKRSSKGSKVSMKDQRVKPVAFDAKVFFNTEDKSFAFDIFHFEGYDHKHAAREIPVSIVSEEGVRFIKTTWLEPCLSTHIDCSSGPGYTELPTRLILIGELEHNLTARLISTQTLTGFVPYVTLSHRWGTAEFITLSSKNIVEFQERLPLNDPKFNVTFREAFHIVHLLGYQYIWIDSLCIVQDSRSDWLHECPRVGMTYKASILNISASSFHNIEHGMLQGRREMILPPRLRTNDQTEYLIVSDRAITTSWHLLKRGWVLQEHLLSARTLHFSESGLVWECQSCLLSEAWPIAPGIPSQHRELQMEFRKKVFGETDARIVPEKTERWGRGLSKPFINTYPWYRIVSQYAVMDLTHALDKLPAIQGLANSMQDTIGSRYLAGHWEKDLVLSLTWEPLRSGSFEPYRESVAPSWSWASVNRLMISFSPAERDASIDDAAPSLIAEYLDADDCESADDGAPPGVHCRLQTRGPMHRLGCNQEEDIIRLPPQQGPIVEDQAGRHAEWKSWPDTRFRLDTPWVPGHFVRCSEDDFTEPDSKSVGVNISIDMQRRVAFETDLEAGLYPMFQTQRTSSEDMTANSAVVFLAWLTLEVGAEVIMKNGDWVDPFRVKGLLLRQIDTQCGDPVCTRLGIIESDIFYPDQPYTDMLRPHWPRPNALETLRGLEKQVFYLV